MTQSHRQKPLDSLPASERRYEEPPRLDENPYRRHLSPPFHTAKEEVFGRRNLPEGRSPENLHEDIGNYGKGGYYGSTYRQDIGNMRWERERYHQGQPDNYRRLGDRRWSDKRLSWEEESQYRTGYRSLRDRANTGNHEGKGPRSWRRADARILEDINDRLYDDPFLNATDVEVAVRDGEVMLTGTVDSRQSKRRAEDIAESVSGVRHLENRLRVI